MDTAARLFDSGKEFWMCASRGDDYSPGYFSPQKENWLERLKSSAVSALESPAEGANA